MTLFGGHEGDLGARGVASDLPFKYLNAYVGALKYMELGNRYFRPEAY